MGCVAKVQCSPDGEQRRHRSLGDVSEVTDDGDGLLAAVDDALSEVVQRAGLVGVLKERGEPLRALREDRQEMRADRDRRLLDVSLRLAQLEAGALGLLSEHLLRGASGVTERLQVALGRAGRLARQIEHGGRSADVGEQLLQRALRAVGRLRDGLERALEALVLDQRLARCRTRLLDRRLHVLRRLQESDHRVLQVGRRDVRGNAFLRQRRDRGADVSQWDVEVDREREDGPDRVRELLEGDHAAVDGLEQHIADRSRLRRRQVVGVQDAGERCDGSGCVGQARRRGDRGGAQDLHRLARLEPRRHELVEALREHLR
jgi:hypothetical protein